MKKIKFIKNFSSPVYGHVYIGKTLMVKPQAAQALIDAGNAELHNDKPVLTKAAKDGDSEPKRSKRPFARKSDD